MVVRDAGSWSPSRVGPHRTATSPRAGEWIWSAGGMRESKRMDGRQRSNLSQRSDGGWQSRGTG
jgi:hypothetical protein